MTSAQNGCSPWCARCSDQPMLSMVRLRRHLARQGHDAMGGDAGDLLGPPGVLGLAVAFAAEIGTELLEAHRVAVEEGLVMESLDQQRVAERQHQRGVGIGPDRQPFDIAAGVEIVGRRRHIDEAHAGVAQAEEAAPVRCAPWRRPR